jgi:GDPmannose 4,6-dehydratase
MGEKLAFISGITGQDGSYLAELLLEKGYKVYGILRRTSFLYNNTRLKHIEDKINFEYGDLTDGQALSNFFQRIITNNPKFTIFEVYNLAAQSHVQISFEIPEYTSLVDGIGTLKMLESIRTFSKENLQKTRFYQAGTSEMFGRVLETPQCETTPFNPQSPYACAKVYSHFLVKNYREGYNMFACNGILFNHESPRRGANFVTMKTVNGIKKLIEQETKLDEIRIMKTSGKHESEQNGKNNDLDFTQMEKKLDYVLTLGNIDSQRDWGHAKDYVRGMWLMLQQDDPDDYVLATGYTCSVRQFIERSFAKFGKTILWEGTGVDEVGKDSKTGRVFIKISEKYFRPCEVDLLLGCPHKAEETLGWTRDYDLDKLIDDMFENS